MTSNDFNTIHVIDDRLKFWDSANYAVKTGGQSITTSVFNAQSASVNSHSFQIQVPSKDTVIDRRIMWTSTVVLRVDGVPEVDTKLVRMGYNFALAPFPLHQLCSTIQCQINANSLSTNVKDILPAILKLYDRPTLNSFNATTPVQPDGAYANYTDGYLGVDYGCNPSIPCNNNTLADYNFGSMHNDYVPRGSFKIDRVGNTFVDGVVGGAQQTGNGGHNVRTTYIQFTVTEPLVALSPWTFTNETSGGLYGITNLTFTMNMDASDRCRALRWSNLFKYGAGAATTCQVVGYSKSSLTMTFITPQSTQVLSPRCIVPYMEMPRFITSAPSIPAGQERDITLNTIALNNIPDMLIIFVRKRLSDQTGADSDFFLPIKGITMNFNNNSGILSGVPEYVLYEISRQNGLNANYQEWSGYATRNIPGQLAGDDNLRVSTCGAPLILQFGKDIQLPSYLAPGSIGNYNLQFTLTVINHLAVDINPELVVITVNSGIFVCHSGSSSVFTGLLSRSDVLDCSQTAPVGHQDIRRLVGSGFMDKLRAIGHHSFRALKKLAPHVLPIAKKLLAESGNEYAKHGANALGMMGYGKSGSALRRHAK